MGTMLSTFDTDEHLAASKEEKIMPDQQLIQEQHPLMLETLKVDPLFATRSTEPTLARVLADIAGRAVNDHLNGTLYDYREVETHPTQASSFIKLSDGTVWAVMVVRQV